MLVLSRRIGETIELPEVGIVVHVVGLRRTKVQLGIDAPQEITVSRGELPRRYPLSAGQPDPRPERERMLAELSRLESELITLTEMARPSQKPAAELIFSEAAVRIAGLRRSIQFQTLNPPQPIGELMSVRGEVIDQLRTTQVDRASAENWVRQSPAGYAVAATCCGVG